jgi:hypothetical protein
MVPQCNSRNQAGVFAAARKTLARERSGNSRTRQANHALDAAHFRQSGQLVGAHFPAGVFGEVPGKPDSIMSSARAKRCPRTSESVPEHEAVINP